MLSLFEQDYFVDETFLKKYPYPITNKNIKKMVETLEYIAADPKIRRAMQEEYWAALNETIWESQVTTLTNQNANLTNQNANLTNQNVNLTQKIAELERMLQQAGITL
jgi:hypothetical protein